MNLSKSLLLIPAASLLLAAAIGTGACGSSVGASITLPGDAIAVSGTVTGLPASCSGQVYWVDQGVSDACGGGSVWYLCDGTTYSDYVCADPGTGWDLETAEADPDSSDTADTSSVTDSGDAGESANSDDGGAGSSDDDGGAGSSDSSGDATSSDDSSSSDSSG